MNISRQHWQKELDYYSAILVMSMPMVVNMNEHGCKVFEDTLKSYGEHVAHYALLLYPELRG
jgi:hypothetical protein